MGIFKKIMVEQKFLVRLKEYPSENKGLVELTTTSIRLPCPSVKEEDRCRMEVGRMMSEGKLPDNLTILGEAPLTVPEGASYYFVQEGPLVGGNGGIIPKSSHGKYFHIRFFK